MENNEVNGDISDEQLDLYQKFIQEVAKTISFKVTVQADKAEFDKKPEQQ